MKRLLILLASLFLILACGAKKGGYTKLPSDTPDWVIKGGGAFKSEKGTALYGVGINTFDPNPAMHRQTADARARQDLAKIIDTYVGSLMKDFMQSHKDFQNPEASSSVQFVSVVSKNVTDATLSGSQIIDHWTDKDGNMYALAHLSFDKLAEMIKAKTAQIAKQQAAFLENKTKEAMEELNKELDKKRQTP